MRKIVRFCSRLEKFKLDSSQYIPRNEPKLSRDAGLPAEHTKNMKELFGNEYASPYEKYDTVIPRVHAGETKSAYERYHIKNNFADTRFLMKIGIFIGFLVCVYVYTDRNKQEQEFNRHIEATRELNKKREKNAEVLGKVYAERKKQYDLLKSKAEKTN